jgi:hypothetical protein
MARSGPSATVRAARCAGPPAPSVWLPGKLENLRAEWNAAGVTDDETGAAAPYPGGWRQAQDQLVQFYGDGSWGTWEITSHEVEIGSSDDAAVSTREEDRQ